jgi:hypothetical protein
MSKEIYEDVAKAMLDKGLPGTLVCILEFNGAP